MDWDVKLTEGKSVSSNTGIQPAQGANIEWDVKLAEGKSAISNTGIQPAKETTLSKTETAGFSTLNALQFCKSEWSRVLEQLRLGYSSIMRHILRLSLL